MTEIDESNLKDIGKGWKAVMKGTYWEEEIPGVERGTELECVKSIKPEDNEGFIPNKFIFKLPQNLDNERLRGKLVVFSIEDVEQWLSPEPTSPS